jgi:hypothetical protein
MLAKAFKQSKSFIAIREQQIHSINEQITKLSLKVPSGVAILSHPRSGVRRYSDPWLISGFFVFCFVNKGVVT